MTQKVLRNTRKAKRLDLVEIIKSTVIYFLGVLVMLILCKWASTEAIPKHDLKFILIWSAVMAFMVFNSIDISLRLNSKSWVSNFGITFLIGGAIGFVGFLLSVLVYLPVVGWSAGSALN